MTKAILNIAIVALVLMLAITGCTSRPAPTQAPSSTLTAPSAPSNLTADTVSQSGVKLHWLDNSHNEEGFRIYRENNLVATVGANVTTYQDTGLEPATTYPYAVKAYNQAGESGASICTVRTPNPPITVRLDRIGVYDNGEHWLRGEAGEVYIGIIVTDGNTKVEKRFPVGEGQFYKLCQNEIADVGATIFSVDEVGDYLRIAAIGYESDGGPAETLIYQALGVAAEGYLSGGTATLLEMTDFSLGNLLAKLFGAEDDWLGSYENAWDSYNNWGIGRYTDIACEEKDGTLGLRLWFTIENPMEPLAPTETLTLPPPTPTPSPTPTPTPAPTPTPTPTPSVVIQNVDMARTIEVSKSHTTTITLRNNQSSSVRVTLKAYSSFIGEFFNTTVVIGANNETVVRHKWYCKTPGERTITYQLFYQGNEIDSWQGTLVATTPSVKKALSVNFDGWYVDTSNVTMTTKDKTVTGRITLSGGDSAQYTIRIRRDIRWADDTTVNQLSFSYNGVSTTKEISFTPPYATDEDYTDGYHIDLIKDGYAVWTLVDAYPPRLRVTVP